MILIENLCKSYKTKLSSFLALDGISLKVEDGESLAIMGKSGAGKTTLLNIIGCLDAFDSGGYYLDGKNISEMNDRKLAKLRNEHFGFVFQDFALVSNKSVLFNVTLPMYFDKTPRSKMKREAEKALSLVDMGEYAEKNVNLLSGGQRQRVAIARAIVKRPRVLLADEPTGALDSGTGKAVMETLVKLNKQGITLIVVTHDKDVANYCGREITVSDGKILSDRQISNLGGSI